MQISSVIKSINTKFVAGLVIGAFSIGVGLHTKESKAVTTALTGSCGMLFNKNFTGLDTFASGTNWTQGGIMLVNFDTGTVLMQTNEIGNYGNSVPRVTKVNTSVTFTQTPDATIPGVYKILTSEGTEVTLLSVNGGNTFLVSVPATSTSQVPGTGVCQRT